MVALGLLGLIGWCAWRFCKKKKPGKKDEEKAKLEDDENALVDNEEVKDDEEEPQQQQESKGRIRYRLEYDFTTQELKITVSECSRVLATNSTLTRKR